MTSPQSNRAIDYSKAHDVIRNAGKNIPRYLFRMWHADSGGDSKLNTTTHITPHAFKDGGGPTSVFDVDGKELVQSISGYLGGKKVKSPFSSWCGSLTWPICALGRSRVEVKNAHISIIDTTQLKSTNHIHWAGHGDWRQLKVDLFAEEYLIFGVVSGPGYQAMPCKEFSMELANELITTKPFSNPDPRALEDDVLKEAVKVGIKFTNKDIQLIVALHLLTLHHDVRANNNVLDELVKHFDATEDRIDVWAAVGRPAGPLPQSSSKPGLGTGDVTQSQGWIETQNANAAVRAMSARQFSSQVGRSISNSGGGISLGRQRSVGTAKGLIDPSKMLNEEP